ncbi:hypothetical protein FAI40_09970 [Acetobacteraceae bacterium]|nr:hypothetical protein FAI40_09970 [Acetobacteraceae bacterium]
MSNSSLSGLQCRKPANSLSLMTVLKILKEMKELNNMNTNANPLAFSETKLDATPAASENATASTLISQVEDIFENLSSSESAAVKAKIRLAGTIASPIISALFDLSKDKLDVQALENGLSKVNDGLLSLEAGTQQVIAALKKKEA